MLLKKCVIIAGGHCPAVVTECKRQNCKWGVSAECGKRTGESKQRRDGTAFLGKEKTSKKEYNTY